MARQVAKTRDATEDKTRKYKTHDSYLSLEFRDFEKRVAAARQTLPFDDVWLGSALARSVHGPRLAVVNIGNSRLSEGFGGMYALRRGTLLWHESTKIPWRIGRIHRWAVDHACPPTRPAW